MARLGLDDRPEVFEWWQEANNQNANVLTMPVRARVVTVGAWLRGVSGHGSVSYRLCVWAGTGGLRGQSAVQSIGTAGVNVSNLVRVEHDLQAPVEYDAGDSLMVGVAWSRNGAMQFGWHDHGSLPNHRERTAEDWPSGMGSATAHGSTGPMSAWVERYDPMAGAWIKRGSAMARAEGVYVRRGGAWVEATGVYVRRSGTWTEAD